MGKASESRAKEPWTQGGNARTIPPVHSAWLRQRTHGDGGAGPGDAGHAGRGGEVEPFCGGRDSALGVAVVCVWEHCLGVLGRLQRKRAEAE